MFRLVFLASSFFLLQAMDAFSIVDRLVYGNWAAKPGDKITQSLNVLLIVTSLWLFNRGFRRIRAIGVGPVLAIAAASFLLLSAAWSIDPQTTVRRGVLYLFVVIGSVGIAGNLNGDEFMESLALTCGIAALGSILLLIVSPHNALMDASTDLAGSFCGIFSHKNTLGQVMAIGGLASLHGIRLGGRKRLRSTLMLGLFTIITVASKSATSFMTLFVFCGADGLITMLRKGGIVRMGGIFLIVFLAPIALFAAVFPDQVLEMIGKDPTLTGRTELWEIVLGYISEKPLLGWGFSAFWASSNSIAVEITDVLGWFVPQAHNGLLEILLNAGIVGAVFYSFLWARNVRLALRCLRTPANNLAVSALLCYGAIILIGISETVMMEPLQITTTVFFVTGLLCEQAVRSTRRRRYRLRQPPAIASATARAGSVP